jgi:hypothetical protein
MRVLVFILIITQSLAVEIIVDASAGRKPISPYIYGRNNSLSDNANDPLSAADWQFLRDAGVTLFREGGGNNSTKYNWRRKLSSHPDWYNNVYAHDWDYAAKSLQQHIPGVCGLYSFQLLGKVAANRNHNFDDWNYNRSQWWEGVHNNWAGGGGPDRGEGNPDLYLMDWPPDSTVAILDHWFGSGGIGMNQTMFCYWNMDNEPGIWAGTHDDAMKEQIPAEAFMQIYFEVAKKARAKYPQIQLVGPVVTNEWQWYNWDGNKVNINGRSYPWLEFFIKRIGEEQKASGIRLLDVLDFHFYPSETRAADLVQLHRVWFDITYDYPGANGVKRSGTGSWDNSITKEYIMQRCRVWLEKYLGTDHRVTFGVTEIGINGDDPNVTAVWYASNLGVFADEGIEIFTPWSWKTGMWEVLHLFSRYHQEIRINTVSDDEPTVSAYASINSKLNTITIVLVNRDLYQSKDVTVSLENFKINNGAFPYRMIDDLPQRETFKSHTDNALEEGTVSVLDSSFTLTLPSLSVTSVQLTGQGEFNGGAASQAQIELEVYPNPSKSHLTILYTLKQEARITLDIIDITGRCITIIDGAVETPGSHLLPYTGSTLSSGIYFFRLRTGAVSVQKKVILLP